MPQLYRIRTDDETLVHLYREPLYSAKCERLLGENDLVLAFDDVRVGRRNKHSLRHVLSKLGVGWVNSRLLKRVT